MCSLNTQREWPWPQTLSPWIRYWLGEETLVALFDRGQCYISAAEGTFNGRLPLFTLIFTFGRSSFSLVSSVSRSHVFYDIGNCSDPPRAVLVSVSYLASISINHAARMSSVAGGVFGP